MSIPEVQSFLGIKSRKTILKYITSGKLTGYKIGGTRWRISVSDVTVFLKAEFNAIGKEKSKKKSVLLSPKQSRYAESSFSPLGEKARMRGRNKNTLTQPLPKRARRNSQVTLKTKKAGAPA